MISSNISQRREAVMPGRYAVCSSDLQSARSSTAVSHRIAGFALSSPPITEVCSSSQMARSQLAADICISRHLRWLALSAATSLIVLVSCSRPTLPYFYGQWWGPTGRASGSLRTACLGDTHAAKGRCTGHLRHCGLVREVLLTSIWTRRTRIGGN